MAVREIEPPAAPGPNSDASFHEDGEDVSLDFVALMRTLHSGRRTVLAATCGAFLILTIVSFVISPRYTSNVSFIPPNLNNSSSLSSALAGQLSMLGAGELIGGLKSPGDLYAGILKSDSIAGELVKQFGLMNVYHVKKESEAKKELDSATSVTVDQKSTIVTVGVTDRSPARAQELADAYMVALRATNGRLALSQVAQRAVFFEQQLAKEKEQLEDAEVELKRSEEQSGLVVPNGQAEVEMRSIAETQAQITARQVQLAAMRDSATEQNPEVIRLESEITDLQQQLSRLQKGGNQAALSIPTSKAPEIQLEYVRKEREVKYHEALFDALSRQYEIAKLDEARDAPVLQILDSASFPDTRSSPKRLYYMVGGLFLGFFGGCLWVLVRDRSREFYSAWHSSEAV